MNSNDRRHNRPVTDELHPVVYVAIVALALWFLLSAWVGFASDGYTAYLLAVVSGLVLIATAIPCALWLASRAGRDSHAAKTHDRFRDRASGDFRTWQDQLKASNAAVQILLPLAAVAFGMTAFAVIVRSIELGII
jgi:hypothetical protein